MSMYIAYMCLYMQRIYDYNYILLVFCVGVDLFLYFWCYFICNFFVGCPFVVVAPILLFTCCVTGGACVGQQPHSKELPPLG